jgi:hypothetical protein
VPEGWVGRRTLRLVVAAAAALTVAGGGRRLLRRDGCPTVSAEPAFLRAIAVMRIQWHGC